MIQTLLRFSPLKLNPLNSGSNILSVAVYRSLDQVLGVLNSPEVSQFQQVQQLLEVASQKNLVTKSGNGKYDEVIPSVGALRRSDESPFIVIEGLDGSGKTTLTEFLRVKFNLHKLETPPEYIRTINGNNVRQFFDNQPETIKRAYYGLGNYLASKDVLDSDKPIVMDRFWHSTTAYAFANFLKAGAGDSCYENEDLSWPKDLVQPNVVIFLTLSEKERLRRHSTRPEFTNTVEEQTLAKDAKFRENLKHCYKKIKGVRFEEFDCDAPCNVTCDNLLKFVSSLFPKVQVQQ